MTMPTCHCALINAAAPLQPELNARESGLPSSSGKGPFYSPPPITAISQYQLQLIKDLGSGCPFKFMATAAMASARAA